MKTLPKRKESQKITDFYTGKLFIQYETTDFQKIIDFYQTGLGLEKTDFSKETKPEVVGLIEFDLPAKGAIISLSKTTAEKIKLNDSLVMEVNDIDKVKEMLTKKQVDSSNIKDIPNMLSFMTVKDPDGNTVMFMSDPRIKN